MLLRNRKADPQGLNPVDHGQQGVVGLDRRAGENQPGANHTRNRSANLGVGALQSCDIDRRLACTQISLCRGFIGPDIIDLLIGNETPVLEREVARRIGSRLGEQRFVAPGSRLRLRQSCGEVGRVHPDEQVALIHVLPLGEEHGRDLTINPRLQRHALISLGPPNHLQAHRNILRDGLSRRHWNRRRLGLFLRTSLAACANCEKTSEQEAGANSIQGNKLSSAYSSSIVSRRRIRCTSAPSTITSAARARVL